MLIILYVLAYALFMVFVLRRWAPPARRVGEDCERSAQQAIQQLDDDDGGDVDAAFSRWCGRSDALPAETGLEPAKGASGNGGVGEGDAQVSSVPALNSGARRDPALRMRIARAAAMEVKAKVGLLKDTEANNLVAGRIIRDYLKERGLRPSHIAQIAPIATVLALMPMRADVEARKMRATAQAYERGEEYYGDWVSVVRRRYGGWAGRVPLIRLLWGDQEVEVRHSLPTK